VDKRVHVFYDGRVQGVGFRYAARLFSRQYGLRGYVKNLADGRVEFCAEGDEKALKSALTAIAESKKHYITDTKLTWSEAQGIFEKFEVAF